MNNNGRGIYSNGILFVDSGSDDVNNNLSFLEAGLHKKSLLFKCTFSFTTIRGTTVPSAVKRTTLQYASVCRTH